MRRYKEPSLVVVYILLWLYVLKIGADDSATTSDVTTVRVAGLFPFSDQIGQTVDDDGNLVWYNGGQFRQVASAAILAVRHFNNRNSTIIREIKNISTTCNVQLDFNIWDTGGSPSITVATYRDIYQETDVLVGSARSASTGPLSITAEIDENVVLSYWATSPSLDVKSLYGYFMRTIPSDEAAAVATVDFFLAWGWSKIGVIAVDDSYGSGYASALATTCSDHGISCSSVSFEDSNLDSLNTALDAMRDNAYAVIFAIVFDADFYDLMRGAYARNMTGPHATWIFSDSVSASSIESLSTNDDLRSAIRGVGKIFATGALDNDPVSQRLRAAYLELNETDFNAILPDISVAELEEGFFRDGLSYDVANYAFDAVMSIGLALCDCQAQTNCTETNGADLLSTLYTTKFTGTSGTVRFDADTGSRLASSANYVVENAQLIGDLSDDENAVYYDDDIANYEALADSPSATIKVTTIGVWSDTKGWTLLDDDTIEIASVSDTSQYWPPIDGTTVTESAVFLFNDGTPSAPADTLPVTCPLGFEVSGRDCVPCDLGYYMPNGTSACVPCDQYAFADSLGSTACIPCGENARISLVRVPTGLGSTSVNDCTCEVNTYSRVWPINPVKGCTECDDDQESTKLKCLGGNCQPSPRSGYWLNPDLSLPARTYRCRYNFYCRGQRRPPAAAGGGHVSGDDPSSGNQTCFDEDGNTHRLKSYRTWCVSGTDPDVPLCESVEVHEGRYFQIANVMRKCPTQINRIFFTVACWLILIVLFAVINEVVRPTYRILDVVLDVYQDLGIVSNFRFSWPIRIEIIFALYYIASFDIDTFVPTCWITEWSFPHTWLVMISLPFVHGLSRLVATLAFTDRSPEAWRKAIGSSLSFLFSSFPALIQTLGSTITERKFKGNGWRLAEEPGWTSNTRTARQRRLVSLLYFFAIILGIPLCVGMILVNRWAKNLLCKRDTLDIFGFAYDAYHADALHWGLVRLFKQLILCTIAIFLWKSPLTQGLLAIAVFLMVGSESARLQPCLMPMRNRFELGGVALCIVSIVLGGWFSLTNNDIENVAYEGVFFIMQLLYVLCAIIVTWLEGRQVRDRFVAEKIFLNTTAAHLHTAKEKDQIELLETFKGRALRRFVLHESFYKDPDGEYEAVSRLDDVLAPIVADDSPLNNFSCSFEAKFYRALDKNLPALLDLMLNCNEDARRVLAHALSMIAHAEYMMSVSGNVRDTACIERIDRSSVLFSLSHCSARHRKEFRKFIQRVNCADRKFRAHRLQADKIRLAILIQRAWRFHRMWESMLPHSMRDLRHLHPEHFKRSSIKTLLLSRDPNFVHPSARTKTTPKQKKSGGNSPSSRASPPLLCGTLPISPRSESSSLRARSASRKHPKVGLLRSTGHPADPETAAARVVRRMRPKSSSSSFFYKLKEENKSRNTEDEKEEVRRSSDELTVVDIENSILRSNDQDATVMEIDLSPQQAHTSFSSPPRIAQNSLLIDGGKKKRFSVVEYCDHDFEY